MYSFYIAVPIDTSVACPIAPAVDNAEIMNESYFANAIVEYRCLPGHWFPDHSIRQSITCLTTGAWDREVEPCLSKCNL